MLSWNISDLFERTELGDAMNVRKGGNISKCRSFIQGSLLLVFVVGTKLSFRSFDNDVLDQDLLHKLATTDRWLHESKPKLRERNGDSQGIFLRLGS